MDPPIINESSFSTANPSSYSLTEIWPFNGNDGGLGLKIGGGFVGGYGDSGESSVTEQSGNGGKKKNRDGNSEDETSLLVSTSSANDLSSLGVLGGARQ
ncbi:hypothetical protein Tco_1526773 [Tanacetum coccineum]